MESTKAHTWWSDLRAFGGWAVMEWYSDDSSEWQIFIVVPFSLCIMNRQHRFPLNDLSGGSRNGTWQAKYTLNLKWSSFFFLSAPVCTVSNRRRCTTCVKVCGLLPWQWKPLYRTVNLYSQHISSPSKKNRCKQHGCHSAAFALPWM